MTIADNSSPPPSPLEFKLDANNFQRRTSQPLLPTQTTQDGASDNMETIAAGRRPSLPSSAVNKTLFYHFPSPPQPTPPQSPRSPPVLRIAPARTSRRPSFTNTAAALRHTRTTSNSRTHSPTSIASSQHTRRRSSLSTTSALSPTSPRIFSPTTASNVAAPYPSPRYNTATMDYGPPPHPAPTAPLPKPPGAPRIPYTTPQQERNRHSSCELYSKLLQLQRQQEAHERMKKRLSAPVMATHKSEPVKKCELKLGGREFRRVKSTNATN